MRTPLLLVAALVAFGCSSSSLPEAPDPGPELPPNFERPESTLATLARSIRHRSAVSYGLVFADTLLGELEFRAFPDSQDVVTYLAEGHAAAPAAWHRSDEVEFFPHFVGALPNELYETTFAVDTARGGVVDLGGPSQAQTWNVTYRVQAGTTIYAEGAASLRLERVGIQADYKITFWNDRRDSQQAQSWGMHRLHGR